MKCFVEEMNGNTRMSRSNNMLFLRGENISLSLALEIFAKSPMSKMNDITLKERITRSKDNSIIFRSDYVQYHPESVGNVLSELVREGIIIRLSPGIYVKPKMSRFGAIMPSIEEIVKAIAERDKAQVLPSGTTALNMLGLSTQIPMTYSYLTTGSSRSLSIGDRKIVFKRSVPKTFAYKTKLTALLVQALRSIGEENIEKDHLNRIRVLIAKEKDKDALNRDVAIMPVWMRKIVKPMLDEREKHETVVK